MRCLIGAAPRWDNMYPYVSDIVAVPFVAPLIFWRLTFRRGLFFPGFGACSLLSVSATFSGKKRCRGWTLQAKTDLQNIMRVLPGCLCARSPRRKRRNMFLFLLSGHRDSHLRLMCCCFNTCRSVIRIPEVSFFLFYRFSFSPWN